MRGKYSEAAMTPGQRAAQRGSVACRPWHKKDLELQLQEVANFIATTQPLVRQMLGPNFTVQIGVTETGRGITFFFEADDK